MKTQVFRGRSMEEAKSAAHSALGGAAEVLATRRVRKNGILGFMTATEFEVTAAAPPSRTSTRPLTSPFIEAVRRSELPSDIESIRTEVRNEVRGLRSLLARSVTDRQGALEGELGEIALRLGMLEERSDKGSNALLRAKLQAMGIEGETAKELMTLLRESTEDVTASLLTVLRAVITATPWPLADDRPSVIAAVGPTGVGKTTTIAKLAANAIQRGRKDLLLVSCDSFRVGAAEQLERYAELMDIDFTTARSRLELEKILASSKADTIFVDTAGRGPSERDGVEAALSRTEGQSRRERNRHVLLCVTASVRDADAHRIAKQFSPCRPTAVAMTKLDETTAPAGIAHISLAANLPISIFCNGQRVPEDIAPATIDTATAHLVKALKNSRRRG